MDKSKLERFLGYPLNARCTSCGQGVHSHPVHGPEETIGDPAVQVPGPILCQSMQFPESDMGISYWFWCWGCDSYHRYQTKIAKGEEKRADGSPSPVWQFNGDMAKPSFTPSYLSRGSPHHCHLYLTAGVLVYLQDCSHSLRGRSIPLGGKP